MLYTSTLDLVGGKKGGSEVGIPAARHGWSRLCLVVFSLDRPNHLERELPRHELEEWDPGQYGVNPVQRTNRKRAHFLVSDIGRKDREKMPVADFSDIKETFREADILEREDVILLPIGPHLWC